MQHFIADDFSKENEKLGEEVLEALRAKGAHSILLFWARQNPDGAETDFISSVIYRDLKLHPFYLIRQIVDSFVKDIERKKKK